MSCFESVLFDLDGTLVDSAPGIEYAITLAVKDVMPERPWPAGRLRSLIGPPIRKIVEKGLPGLPAESYDELVRQFRTVYDRAGWRRTVLYDGVAHTLGCLKQGGVRLFVITNKPKAPTEQILDDLGLSSHFEAAVCPDSRQPPFESKAEAADELIAGYGLDVNATLFVGDSGDDARAAQACGVRFAAAAYGYGDMGELSAQQPHAVIWACPELLAVVTDTPVGVRNGPMKD